MSAPAINVPARESRIRAVFGAVAAGLGQGFSAYLNSRSCVAEFERLNRLSDAALAAKGLSRDGIAQHVFRRHFGS